MTTRNLISPEELAAFRGDMTQQELSDLWMTPLATIQGWEHGKRSIPGIVAYIVKFQKNENRAQ